MTGAIVTGAAVTAALIAAGWLIDRLRRAARLERLREAHDRYEADLEALAVVSEPRACGCQWVPCDKHVDRLAEAALKEGEGL